MGLTQKLGTIPLAVFTDSSNNVGIGGAANASFKLQVTGTTNVTGVLTLGSTISNGTFTYTLPAATGTLALTSAIPANPVGGTGTTNYLPKFTGASTIGNSSIIDNGTSVNIGSGYKQLTISYPSTFATKLGIGDSNFYIQTDASPETFTFFNTTGTGDFIFKNGVSATTRLTLNGSGNLGLGVTPSAWGSLFAGGVLQVKNASLLGYLNNTYLSANAYFTNSSDNYIASDYATRYVQASGQHRWETAPSGTAGNAITFTQAMTLNASGNLGVGTSSPSERLHISSSASSTEIRIENSTTSAYIRSQTDNLNFYFNGADRMRIFSNGNIGVGTTTDAGYKLDVNGTGRFSGNLEVFSGSAGVTVGDFLVNPTTKYVYVGRQSSTSGDNTTFVVRDRTGSARATIPGGGSIDTVFSTNNSNFIVSNYSGNSLMTIANTGAATFAGSNLTLQNSSEAEVRSLSTSTGNYANFIVDTDNTVNYRLQMVGFGTTAAGTLAGINRAANGFVVKSGGALAVGTRDSNPLVFSTNEAERMRITNDGNVLIGTTSVPTASAGTIMMLSNTIFFNYTSGVSAPYTQSLRVDIVWNNWGSNHVVALIDVDFLAREFGNLGGVSFGRIYALSSGGASTFNNTINTTNVTTANGTLAVSSPANFMLRLLFTPTNVKDYIGCFIRIPINSAGTGSSVASITATLV